ncbi:MAG: outer membrane protein assembly factor BamB family protein [Gemmatimonadaceae bacterium]
MPRPPARLIYVGIKRHVLAIDQSTGAEVWRTRLEGQRMRSNDFVHLTLDEERLYATTSGELYCLEKTTGEVMWHNQLTGLGTGLVSIVSGGAPTDGGAPASLFARAARDQAARQAAAT